MSRLDSRIRIYKLTEANAPHILCLQMQPDGSYLRRVSLGRMRQRNFTRSAHLLKTSRAHLAAGVSSLVRAGSRPPLFFQSAKGSRLTDVDGNSYIDYALAWGPLILGHSHPAVISSVHRQLD